MRRLIRSLAGMTTITVVAFAAPAVAQPLPTVADVADELYSECLFDDAGAPLDLATCLAAVSSAIGVANAYGDVPQVPPQVDIGFLLCELAVDRPSIAGDIIALINQSGNPNLGVGCSNALGPDWDGPQVTIISPA